MAVESSIIGIDIGYLERRCLNDCSEYYCIMSPGAWFLTFKAVTDVVRGYFHGRPQGRRHRQGGWPLLEKVKMCE